MKKIFSFLVAFLALATMTVAGAQAFNANNHVYSSKNMVGDALIFPFYYAGGTWKTNLRVINTSPDHCVVAKVVFREGTYSCEARDFLIYLTPNDVWTADVVDVDGVIRIQSTDDSSPENPMDVEMGIPCNNGPTDLGYVEVYEAASFSITKSGSVVTPLKKSVLKAAYKVLDNNATKTIPSPQLDGSCNCTGTMITSQDTSGYKVEVCSVINMLTGREEIGSPVDNITLGLNAEALANNRNTRKLNPVDETRWDNYGDNTAVEVRAALAKDQVFMPFNVASPNATFGIFTFPVRLSCCLSGADNCTTCKKAADVTDRSNAGCRLKSTTVTATSYNMEEAATEVANTIYSPAPSTTWNHEVMLFDASNLASDYSQGWIRLKLSDEDSLRTGTTINGSKLTYTGSAVIPTALEVKNGDLYWIHLPYHCGDASIDDTAIGSFKFINGCYHDVSPNTCNMTLQ